MIRIILTLKSGKTTEIDPLLSLSEYEDHIGIWNGYHTHKYKVKDIEKVEFVMIEKDLE